MNGVNLRIDWNTYFINLARVVAARADCTRRKVGAVLVDQNRRIIATGYNGAPSEMPGCLTEGACPRGRSEVAPMTNYDLPGQPGYCIAVHAEANALLYATRDTAGATCYVTDEPCPGCTKLLAAAGVQRVFWLEDDELDGASPYDLLQHALQPEERI